MLTHNFSNTIFNQFWKFEIKVYCLIIIKKNCIYFIYIDILFLFSTMGYNMLPIIMKSGWLYFIVPVWPFLKDLNEYAKFYCGSNLKILYDHKYNPVGFCVVTLGRSVERFKWQKNSNEAESNFCRIVMRPTMVYSSKCWTVDRRIL